MTKCQFQFDYIENYRNQYCWNGHEPTYKIFRKDMLISVDKHYRYFNALITIKFLTVIFQIFFRIQQILIAILNIMV